MKTFRLSIIVFLSAVILLFGSLTFAEDSPDPGSSEELQAKVQAFEAEQKAIRGELEALKAANAGATEQERKAAMDQWLAENADRIQAQKALMSQIRSELKDDFNAAVGEKIRTRNNARERMRQKLEDMTPEDREVAKEELKQRLRQKRAGN
jgi:hypothetical protein